MGDGAFWDLQLGFVIAYGRILPFVLGGTLGYALILAIISYFPRPAKRITYSKGVLE